MAFVAAVALLADVIAQCEANMIMRKNQARMWDRRFHLQDVLEQMSEELESFLRNFFLNDPKRLINLLSRLSLQSNEIVTIDIITRDDRRLMWA